MKTFGITVLDECLWLSLSLLESNYRNERPSTDIKGNAKKRGKKVNR